MVQTSKGSKIVGQRQLNFLNLRAPGDDRSMQATQLVVRTNYRNVAPKGCYHTALQQSHMAPCLLKTGAYSYICIYLPPQYFLHSFS